MCDEKHRKRDNSDKKIILIYENMKIMAFI